MRSAKLRREVQQHGTAVSFLLFFVLLFPSHPLVGIRALLDVPPIRTSPWSCRTSATEIFSPTRYRMINVVTWAGICTSNLGKGWSLRKRKSFVIVESASDNEITPRKSMELIWCKPPSNSPSKLLSFAVTSSLISRNRLFFLISTYAI